MSLPSNDDTRVGAAAERALVLPASNVGGWAGGTAWVIAGFSGDTQVPFAVAPLPARNLPQRVSR
jgi:hypothetical protein